MYGRRLLKTRVVVKMAFMHESLTGRKLENNHGLKSQKANGLRLSVQLNA